MKSTDVVAPESAPVATAAAPRVPRWRPSPGIPWGIGVFLVLLVIAAQVVYPGFLGAGNVANILSQGAPIGIVAVAMTYVMIGGGFDLSVGAMVAMSSVVYAQLSLSAAPATALVLSLVLGAVLGGVNGTLVGVVGLNPFVATLATGSVYAGLGYVISDSSPIVVDLPGFQAIGQGRLASVPISVWLLAGVVLVAGVFLARSVFGHCLYAIGGNAEATRLAGVRVTPIRSGTYVLLGVSAAVAGIILTSRLGVGQATLGADITLDVITIVVIGGTSLFGGEGSVARTVIGLLVIGVILNVADSQGWNANVENIVKGVVLLGAVSLDLISRRSRSRRVVAS